MPVVRVQMWPGRTQAQKAELARVITEAMVAIAHTKQEAVTVIFEDVAKDNWAQGGVLASEAKTT
ncbi:MAG: 4-oxalocrotonate tautomerase family protein [Dehalococcoidia bacterium]